MCHRLCEMAFLDWDGMAFPRPRLRKPGAKPSPRSLAEIAAGLPAEEALLEDVRRESVEDVPSSPRSDGLNFEATLSTLDIVIVRSRPIPYPYLVRKLVVRQITGTDGTAQLRLHSSRTDQTFGVADIRDQIWPGRQGVGDTLRLSTTQIEVEPWVFVPRINDILHLYVRSFGTPDSEIVVHITFEEVLGVPVV